MEIYFDKPWAGLLFVLGASVFLLVLARVAIEFPIVYFITRPIISAGIIYYTWFCKNKAPFAIRIISTLFALSFIVILLPVSEQFFIAFSVVLGLIMLVVTVVMAVREGNVGKGKARMIFNETLIMGVLVSTESRWYTYVESGSNSVFLLIGLVVGGIALLISLPFVNKFSEKKNNQRKRKNQKNTQTVKKQKKPYNKVSMCLMVFLMTFVAVWISVAHMNFVFSPKPVPVECVIENKVSRGAKYRTYEFFVNVGGEELKVKVDFSIYVKSNEGDKITLLYYEGAFGKPFYIFAENWGIET